MTLRRAAAPACAVAALVVLTAAVVPRERCREDALERWFCPSEPQGVAVLDNLGAVVCAPGSCVEFGDEWHCSDAAGGRAELTTGGPVCEGGCRAPRAVDCEQM